MADLIDLILSHQIAAQCFRHGFGFGMHLQFPLAVCADTFVSICSVKNLHQTVSDFRTVFNDGNANG